MKKQLSATDIQQIRARIKSTSIKILAKEFGVSYKDIYRIIGDKK